MHIFEAIDEYLGSKQNSITHDTYKWYEYHLDVFSTWCKEHSVTDITSITPRIVQQAVSAHHSTNGNTKHGYVQVIKGFLSWCAEDDELGVREKTVKRIELPKVTQPDVDLLSKEDINALFRACDTLKHPHRNRAILSVLLDTGVRASELCVNGRRLEEDTGLRMEDLIIGRGAESFIRVVGKGQKIRTIGLGNETRLAVQKYLHRERGRNDNPFVFLAQGDEPLSVRMLQQLLGKLGSVAGVDNVHAHRFRHTFAVNQLLNGTSSLVLMQLMGHSTLDSTKIYVRAMSHVQARQSAISVVDTMRNPRKAVLSGRR